MSRVFIIEPLRHHIDISKAKDFGEIIYLFKPMQRRVGVFDHVRFGQAVLKQLSDYIFDPEKDCICVVGSIVTVSIALIAIAQTHLTFSALLFNSSNDSYEKKTFDTFKWEGQYDGQ